MRFIGLDVHKDFCEVAVAEGGACWSGPRVRSTPEDLEVFGQSLSLDDQVVLEATGGALAIARILERHAGRVVMANPMAVRAIASAKAKTDRLDARTLARLLAAGFLPAVWMGDERTRLLRRLVSRHAQLVKQRTRAKNQVHAVLQRTVKGRPPASDLFGTRGRAWLGQQELPADERETVQAALRHIDFLDGELRLVDRTIAEQVLSWPEVRRIMTIPGMGAMAAAGVMAAIGDIARFPSPRHLVGYLGLDARVRKSGSAPARHGGISKQGSSEARHLLVEAAWAALRTPGPLRAFASGSGPGAAPTSPRWPWPASSPCCAGTCSPAKRTTRSPGHPSFGRRCDASSSPRARSAGSATATRCGSSPRQPSASWSANSESRPRRRTAGSSTTSRPRAKGVRVPPPGRASRRTTRPEQRGRDQPQTLLFSSRSPTPPPHREQEDAECPRRVDFHP